MTGREVLQDLIPHQGSMCLLDAVVAWDAAQVHATSRSHQRADNPLRGADGLAALHLCEYGAQAMAVHGGLLASAQGGRALPGLLVSLRAVELHVDTLDALDDELHVHAQMLHADASGWQYGFHVEHRGALLARGRAAVMLQQGEPR
jgi:predicted hotdog family 3-hydroxylacyl-ACP dehydratase